MVVRNYAAGSMAQRLGVEEGTKSPVTIVDICYKKDELGDPLINDYHVLFLGVATREELDTMYALTLKINSYLQELFEKMNIILVDFKIELGRLSDGTIILADEISPDTCRLWDKDTMKKLDKDRFRSKSKFALLILWLMEDCVTCSFFASSSCVISVWCTSS